MTVLRSPYPEVEIPPLSLSAYVMGEAAGRGDKPALIDGATGAVTTYAELAERVARTAAGLAGQGIGKGDAVGLLGPNSADWVVAFHAASALGAIVTSVNPLLTPDEVGKQLASADAKAVIAAGALRDAVAGSGTVFELESLPEADGDVGDPGWIPRATSPCCRSRAARPGCRRA